MSQRHNRINTHIDMIQAYRPIDTQPHMHSHIVTQRVTEVQSHRELRRYSHTERTVSYINIRMYIHTKQSHTNNHTVTYTHVVTHKKIQSQAHMLSYTQAVTQEQSHSCTCRSTPASEYVLHDKKHASSNTFLMVMVNISKNLYEHL